MKSAMIQSAARSSASKGTEALQAARPPGADTMAVPIAAHHLNKPMEPSDDDAPAHPQSPALLWLLLAVSLAFGWILLPFYGTIMWGATIALLFTPLYRWLLARLGGRRSAAALLTLLMVLIIVIIPLTLVIASLAREAALVYQGLESGALNPVRYFQGVFDALPDWVTALLDRFGLIDFATLQRRLSAALAQGSQFIATQALSIGQNTFEFIASLFVALYLAFFLLRDGERIARSVRHAIPLAPAHKRALFSQFTAVILATVKGNLLVAALQGALGGLAFWFLGVSAPLLWAVLMAFLSLLPAVGAGLVWAPVALYFLVTGAIWQAVALVAFGVLVIGLVDNLLRPVLVGKDAGLPDYLVMITTLGGMAVFGINGFVLGPVIAAMFIAVWHIYGARRRGD